MEEPIAIDGSAEPKNPPLAYLRGPVALSIKAKYRRGPFEFAAPNDFRFDIDRTISVSELQRLGGLSLYCLDDEAKRLFFVETSDAQALETSPFIYQTQFEQATRLLAVPYEDLEDIAAPIEFPPIFILSIGRVGSTLLSNLFNTIPEVRSFSEPDVFTQLAVLRLRETGDARRGRDREIVKLISLATRCLQPIGCAQHHRRLVIKHRSHTNPLSELFLEAFPKARIIFMHREPGSWARSVARAFGYNAKQLTWLWRTGANGYARLLNAKAEMLNVRYEEIQSDGMAAFRRILEFCAIAFPDDTTAIERTLDKDSQQGTTIMKSQLDSANRDVNDRVSQFLKEIAGQPAAFQE